jgi:hypothetical protein
MSEVYVEGAEVVRIHKNGGGFSAHKSKQLRNGETKVEKFTVWTTDPVEVGAMVSFRGVLSVKVEEFTNDEGLLVRYAAIHVNDPVMTSAGSSQASEDDAPF